ncbi:hypothetical protein AA0488_0218 [Kozakia baliensis NRIC 0488]|nr:hypothetical protein AA0488_0218 [Kozakia baliensis NRIC 0488]
MFVDTWRARSGPFAKRYAPGFDLSPGTTATGRFERRYETPPVCDDITKFRQSTSKDGKRACHPHYGLYAYCHTYRPDPTRQTIAAQ